MAARNKDAAIEKTIEGLRDTSARGRQSFVESWTIRIAKGRYKVGEKASGISWEDAEPDIRERYLAGAADDAIRHVQATSAIETYRVGKSVEHDQYYWLIPVLPILALALVYVFYESGFL